MSKVTRCGVGLMKADVLIDAQLVIDPVWKNYPKVFHIWVYIQSCKEVSYGLIAKSFGISVNSVAKHIRTMKEMEFSSGAPVLQVDSIFNKEKTNKISDYRITSSFAFRNPDVDIIADVRNSPAPESFNSDDSSF